MLNTQSRIFSRSLKFNAKVWIYNSTLLAHSQSHTLNAQARFNSGYALSNTFCFRSHWLVLLSVSIWEPPTLAWPSWRDLSLVWLRTSRVSVRPLLLLPFKRMPRVWLVCLLAARCVLLSFAMLSFSWFTPRLWPMRRTPSPPLSVWLVDATMTLCWTRPTCPTSSSRALMVTPGSRTRLARSTHLRKSARWSWPRWRRRPRITWAPRSRRRSSLCLPISTTPRDKYAYLAHTGAEISCSLLGHEGCRSDRWSWGRSSGERAYCRRPRLWILQGRVEGHCCVRSWWWNVRYFHPGDLWWSLWSEGHEWRHIFGRYVTDFAFVIALCLHRRRRFW